MQPCTMQSNYLRNKKFGGGVYKISKIKDIRSIDGYKKFAEMINERKTE